MGFWNLFVAWNHQAVLQNRSVNLLQQRNNEAFHAEDTVAAAVHELGHPNDATFLRRRVYMPSQRRCREIDVLVLTDMLYVVEVKNWSGEVWRNGLKWFQRPPTKTQRAIEYGDLDSEIKMKAENLVRHLKLQGISLPTNSVCHCIVFTSDKCKLCPRSVKTMPNVFTLEEFQGVIGTPHSGAHSWAASWVPQLFCAKDEIPPVVKSKIRAALDVVRTWDAITLHSGEKHTGDICRIEVMNPGQKMPAISLGRGDITDAMMDWVGLSWLGLLRALWQGHVGALQVLLSPKAKVRTRPPQSAPQFKSGSSCTVSTKGGGMVAQTTDDHPLIRSEKDGSRILTVPFRPWLKKKTAQSAQNVVIFRQAGQKDVRSFPLSMIADLECSKSTRSHGE